jgi:putative transposase
VENANGLGRHLAQWLIARGERVVDLAACTVDALADLTRTRPKKMKMQYRPDALDGFITETGLTWTRP